MVDFGIFEDWHPEPGTLTSWTASPHSRNTVAKAPAHHSPPSYQQQEYLRTALRNADKGFRSSRLCMIAFDIPGTPDHAAMTRTVNAFLRRHDTFHSWFELADDGHIVRHVTDSDSIEFTPTTHGHFADAQAIRDHVQNETPGPFQWDCCSFGIIEHPDSFTVYAAVDHLHTDGVAQALSCVDLLLLYGAEVSGTEPALAPVDGHIDHSVQERRRNAELDADSAPVRRWVQLLQRNGGDLPQFPLDLGVRRAGYIPGSQRTMPLFEEADAVRFEQFCAAHGGKFLSGVCTALALTEYELAGRDFYFGLTPVNTRSTDGEAGSVGWYTNLVPVTLPVAAADSFTSLVGKAQQSYEQARELTHTSLHRVLELLPPDSGIRTRRGWSAPMLSYIDVRRIAGVDMFDQINGGMFGNRASSSQVYIWINRFNDVTKISLLFPDTEQAHAAVDRYIRRLTAILTSVAADGEYTLGGPAVDDYAGEVEALP